MSKTADKLDALADRMQKDIDHARRPMTQNPTPKRTRDYNARLHDANNWERGQRAMRALAQAHLRQNHHERTTEPESGTPDRPEALWVTRSEVVVLQRN
jgi:hypothetical protein